MMLAFRGEIWFWKGPAPWYFVTVPEPESRELEAVASLVTYGWGMVPVDAEIGGSRWTTCLTPKDGRYVLPIKAAIRRAERVDEGDTVAVRLHIDVDA